MYMEHRTIRLFKLKSVTGATPGPGSGLEVITIGGILIYADTDPTYDGKRGVGSGDVDSLLETYDWKYTLIKGKIRYSTNIGY